MKGTQVNPERQTLSAKESDADFITSGLPGEDAAEIRVPRVKFVASSENNPPTPDKRAERINGDVQKLVVVAKDGFNPAREIIFQENAAEKTVASRPENSPAPRLRFGVVLM
jgi:hypothetical protein